MSYTCTIYFNDPLIATTNIEAYYIGYYDSRDYGSNYVTFDLPDGAEFRLSAIPVSGAYVSHWVYRLGSTSATQQIQNGSSFTYSGDQNIYVRAVGAQGSASSGWMLDCQNIGSVGGLKHYSIYINQNTIYRFGFISPGTGTITAYTTGSTDTIGYIGNSSQYDDSTGIPYNYGNNPSSDDDAGEGNNFRTENYSVSAGDTFYVWVRGYSGSTSGYTTLYVDIPMSSGELTQWTVVEDMPISSNGLSNYEVEIEKYGVYRYSFNSTSSGTISVSTTGGVDTIGYIGDNTSLNPVNGVPGYLTYNDDFNGNRNMSISDFSISANKTYYIWIRAYDNNYVGQKTYITISINGSGGGGGGDAPVVSGDGFYIYNGSTWRKAIPYIYNGSSWVRMYPCVYNGSSWVKGT